MPRLAFPSLKSYLRLNLTQDLMNESVHTIPIKKNKNASYLSLAALSARGKPRASWKEGHSNMKPP